MNRGALAGIVAGVSFVGGAVAGYFFAGYRLKDYYKDIAGQEIRQAREYYTAISKKGAEDINKVAEEMVPPEELAAAKAMLQYRGKSPAKDDPRVELIGGTQPPMDVIIQNVFNKSAAGEDDATEDELRRRSEEAPYIVSKREYFESTLEYEQETLTYYTMNNVLCEQDDTVIDDIDDVVGQENLQHFGHHSGDPNVLYIRNDYLEKDYEILLNHQDYTEVVAGLGG